MRLRVPKVVAGGLVAAALTAAIGGAAWAQSATPTPGGKSAAAQQRAQDFLNAFAARLGKAPADVLAAFKSVEKDRVAQAVKDGKLTQPQADQANQRIDRATGLPFGGPGFERGREGAHGRGDSESGPGNRAALAGFLGIQPQDLATALRSGKSLAQVAQDKGKTRDALKAFLTSQEKTRLDAAVQAGRLTQAQADQRLQATTARLDQLIDRTGRPGRGPEGPEGSDEHGPGGRGGAAPVPGVKA